MTQPPLPVGKLPPPLLAKMLAEAPTFDSRVIVGPGPGIDCAVIDIGPTLLVFKSDPITFVADDIGWYLVQVNANDIATTGAIPRWLLLTLLLPERTTTDESAMRLVGSVYDACAAMGVSVLGGHTEVTYGIDRPIAMGTMVGEVDHGGLVTPKGAMSGDRILLTKGVAIEATAIIAREFHEKLRGFMGPVELQDAEDFLKTPGISVLADAQIAISAGKVTAMHDPTEGGLWSALWELAEASGHTIVVDPDRVLVPTITAKICRAMAIDPYAAISSGALLLTSPPGDSSTISEALELAGIQCVDIGFIDDGSPIVWRTTGRDRARAPRPQRDEIARLFESASP